MTVQEASRVLSERYRYNPGVTSIGYADHPGDPHIVIYTRWDADHWRTPKDIPAEVGGFRIDVKCSGPIQFCAG